MESELRSSLALSLSLCYQLYFFWSKLLQAVSSHGWSESGKIAYKGFPHEMPAQFPFTDVGAHKFIGTDQLTYNWNTAGVGFVSKVDGVEVFSVRNTGSLPCAVHAVVPTLLRPHVVAPHWRNGSG